MVISVVGSIAGNLATAALRWLYNAAQETSAVRDLQSMLGSDAPHPKIKKVFEEAIHESSREFKQIDDAELNKFFDVGDNKK